MTNAETKFLKEIRDNTKQLERIAKRLDAISRQLVSIAEQTEPKGEANDYGRKDKDAV